MKALKSIPIVALGMVCGVAQAQTAVEPELKLQNPDAMPKTGAWTLKVAGSGQLLLSQNGTWQNNYLKATTLSGSVLATYRASKNWSFAVVDFRDNVGYTNLWVNKSSTLNPGVTYTTGHLSLNPVDEINTNDSSQRGVFSAAYDLSMNAPFLGSPDTSEQDSTPTKKNLQFHPLAAFVTAATPFGLSNTTTTYQNVKLDAPLKIILSPVLSLDIDATEYYLPNVVGVKSTSTITYKASYNPVILAKSVLTGNFAVQYSNGSTDADYGPAGFTGNSKLTFSAGLTYRWSSAKKK